MLPCLRKSRIVKRIVLLLMTIAVHQCRDADKQGGSHHMHNDDVVADDDDNAQGDTHQTEETHPLTLPNSCFTTVGQI